MEHTNRDSSGTEDDLPNHDVIRTSRAVLSGAMRITSGPVYRETNLPDMKFQIHCLEREGYGAVLRAFFAQSDSLSWGKEALITDLRKELRVSDDEHREILGAINSDESIKEIREWRSSADAHKLTATNPAGFDAVSVGHVPRKKLKTGHNTVLSSPKQPLSQPSPVLIPSAIAVHVRDDQWGNNAALHSSQMNVGPATVPVHQNKQALSTGKVRGSLIVHASKKGFVQSGVENFKPGADIIEIRATDKLVYDVEKVCGGGNPDPVQVEKAKLVLREHERALMEAIGKLADMTDGDESPDKKLHRYPSEVSQRNAYAFHNAAYIKLDKTRGFYTDGYMKDHAEIAGIPCIDLPDDEYD